MNTSYLIWLVSCWWALRAPLSCKQTLHSLQCLCACNLHTPEGKILFWKHNSWVCTLKFLIDIPKWTSKRMFPNKGYPWSLIPPSLQRPDIIKLPFVIRKAKMAIYVCFHMNFIIMSEFEIFHVLTASLGFFFFGQYL